MNSLSRKYNRLQKKYGDETLDSIISGGSYDRPICFTFMNPTGRNIASTKSWEGLKAPWIGTKQVWKLFYEIGFVEDSVYKETQDRKPKDWDYGFSNEVYGEIKKNNGYITNLAKCTQVDARPLRNSVFKKYLHLFHEEIDIIKPKKIITFGNQVSSILLDQNISISKVRRKKFSLIVNQREYSVYPVYYPVGQGMRNIGKAVEDIKWILNEDQSKKTKPTN